ncbi:hypothetical protein JYT28_01335 [Desulfobulbus sp. AH-315-M07]|nr:hypothetical protein [Desulfobulbus sp. AH-315-M07]
MSPARLVVFRTAVVLAVLCACGPPPRRVPKGVAICPLRMVELRVTTLDGHQPEADYHPSRAMGDWRVGDAFSEKVSQPYWVGDIEIDRGQLPELHRLNPEIGQLLEQTESLVMEIRIRNVRGELQRTLRLPYVFGARSPQQSGKVIRVAAARLPLPLDDSFVEFRLRADRSVDHPAVDALESAFHFSVRVRILRNRSPEETTIWVHDPGRLDGQRHGRASVGTITGPVFVSQFSRLGHGFVVQPIRICDEDRDSK